MPTFWTRTLIPTSRQVPAEAEVPSHQLLLRAGYIRKVGSGIYDYLPLGWRSLQKAMAIVRQEMDAAGAVELMLPVLQPIELWERTGRRTDYGPNLFVVKDRHGREQALGPTHEEIITELVAAYVESYKDLPLTLYQIQTKFRDEFRPRFGVLRSREFQMMDAYSFHLVGDGPTGLDAEYQNMHAAYCRIFDRCGLPYEVVQAESGPIGGSASHEFMVPSHTGEDTILKSDRGNYAANVEKCVIGERPYDLDGDPTGELEEVHTPDCRTIDDVCSFFKKRLGSKLNPENMLKTLVCQSKSGDWILAVVRGDHDLNEGKLRVAVDEEVTLADESGADAAGFTIGFVGPHAATGRDDVKLVIDFDAARKGFLVTGANRADHHVRHFNWKRLLRDEKNRTRSDLYRVADIRNAVDGDPAPAEYGGGTLHQTKGIELGHIFKLGAKYSTVLDASVLDEKNQRQPLLMGCYGIGINRILAAAIEKDGGHDDSGIIWPAALAPHAVLITPIKYQGQVKDTVDQLAAQLEERGVEVLVDDRDERPGVKFKDADLIGLPLRLTVGDKSLASGVVELKARNGSIDETVPVAEAVERVLDALSDL